MNYIQSFSWLVFKLIFCRRFDIDVVSLNQNDCGFSSAQFVMFMITLLIFYFKS